MNSTVANSNITSPSTNRVSRPTTFDLRQETETIFRLDLLDKNSQVVEIPSSYLKQRVRQTIPKSQWHMVKTWGSLGLILLLNKMNFVVGGVALIAIYYEAKWIWRGGRDISYFINWWNRKEALKQYQGLERFLIEAEK